MARANLASDLSNFQNETRRLEDLIGSIERLSAAHRKIVAEIILIRLFLLAENTVESICLKLVCGAEYLDGSVPRRLVGAGSKAAAGTLIRQFGRTKARTKVSWGSSRDIRENLKHTMDPGDQVFGAIANYGGLLTEMRYVRNHVAHNNASTRGNFRKVVRNYYGGLRQGVSPGVLLLTRTWGMPVVLEKYLRHSRIMIKELVGG